MKSPAPAICGWKDGWYLVPHQVTWQDVDGMRHVNNAVYFQYFEWARTKYWLELHAASDLESITFVVARAECDFRAELKLLDHIEIGVRIAALRNSSFDFVYEVRRVADGTVAATGRVVVVLFSWAEHNRKQIDGELRQKIDRFQMGG